jgi:hypothetical protein
MKLFEESTECGNWTKIISYHEGDRDLPANPRPFGVHHTDQYSKKRYVPNLNAEPQPWHMYTFDEARKKATAIANSTSCWK